MTAMHPCNRVLVYIDAYAPYANAVTNAVMPAVRQLAKRCRVDVFTARMDRGAPRTEICEQTEITRFESLLPHFRIRLAEAHHRSPHTVSPPLRPVVRLLRHNGCYRLLDRLYCAFLSPVQRKLKRLLLRGGYDTLITVSSPITPQLDALALAKRGVFAANGIRWIPYFVDPFATFIGYREMRDDLMPLECAVFEAADTVITSPELAADYLHYPLGAFAEKTKAVPFTNLRALPETGEADFLTKGKINCLYVGSLFCVDVRDPSYFYRLAAACPEDIEFHIVCYEADEPNLRLKRELLDGLPRVHWHERLPLEMCLGAMCKADVLINLGNLCSNQTPSKVFDYMGAGRPIVNLYGIDADTSMAALSRYPMRLNVRNKAALDPADVAAFSAFCRENAGKRIAFSEVAARYPELTADACAQTFVDIVTGAAEPGEAARA